jgi:hypothetical protein
MTASSPSMTTLLTAAVLWPATKAGHMVVK